MLYILNVVQNLQVISTPFVYWLDYNRVILVYKFYLHVTAWEVFM